MVKIIKVTKRDGRTEPFDLDKVHKVLEWATDGISGVSISEIELKANIQLYDGIHAYDIHELLIKSAAELISDNTPNYQFVAARLINYKLRKDVYGQYEPWLLSHLIEKNIELGVYDSDILNKYTEEELEKLDTFIKHERDDLFTYVGMEQFRGKYLAQDRSTKKIYETPQMLYMMIAATLFSNYPEETRLKWVKEFYDAVSQFYISLPTPIMGVSVHLQDSSHRVCSLKVAILLTASTQRRRRLYATFLRKLALVLELVQYELWDLGLAMEVSFTRDLYRSLSTFNQRLSHVHKAELEAEQRQSISRSGT